MFNSQFGFLRTGRSMGLLLLVLGIALLLNLRETGRLWPWGKGADPLPVMEQIDMLVAADCDPVRSTCTALAEELVLRVHLGPQVKPLQPFTVLVSLQGEVPQIDRMELEFRMRDMDMGQNRYGLQQAAPGQWQAVAVLPICTTQRVDWIARIGLRVGSKLYIAEIPFSTN